MEPPPSSAAASTRAPEQHLHAQQGMMPPPAPLHKDSIRLHGWQINTVKGPIIADRDTAAFRDGLQSDGVYSLPEMLFNQSKVTLLHEASGVCISLTAQDALREWRQEGLPALQVSNAKAWQSARRQEIAQQNAVQLEWDWTYTTPYCGTLLRVPPAADAGVVTRAPWTAHAATPSGSADAAAPSPAPAAASGAEPGAEAAGMVTKAPWATASSAAGAAAAAAAGPEVVTKAPWAAGAVTKAPWKTAEPAAGAAAAAGAGAGAGPGAGVVTKAPWATPWAAAAVGAAGTAAAAGTDAPLPSWEETTEQIDRGILMERDPILFFDEVPLYESDLDDNGVCQLTVKLRVMPKCWLVLLRLWIRVDGCMVRLRETRLFCRTDQPSTCGMVLREVRHVEGSFSELRAAGAPDEGPAYSDADAASQVFQAVAPVGVKKFKLHKLIIQ